MANEVHVPGEWIAAAVASAGTAFTAVLVFLGQRLIGKAALDTMLNQRFTTLIDQLQEERVVYQTETAAMRKDLIAERAARQDEQIQTAAERASLRGEIRNLTQVIESLKAIMRANGLQVPQTKNTDPAPQALELRQEWSWGDESDD